MERKCSILYTIVLFRKIWKEQSKKPGTDSSWLFVSLAKELMKKEKVNLMSLDTELPSSTSSQKHH
jgi:hypothetical protein